MYYVYILTNITNSILYIGVTNNIQRRIFEHKSDLIDGFSKKYHLHKLIYIEEYGKITDAIAREKQLKKWTGQKKEWLINTVNSEWKDLS